MKIPQTIKALILDVDGVLWRAGEAIGDLPAIFDAIAARGLKVALATNNSTKTPGVYLQQLAELGVNLELSQIVNSSLATASLLKEKFPDGGDVYVVGQNGLMEALREEGFTPFTGNEEPPSPIAVVAGMDMEINYKKLTQATLLIRAGAPFYATNADKTYPTPRGQYPGAGTILAALTTATDVEPIVAGKPQPYLFQLAMQRMGVSPEETLMVGDRLTTDILGGQNAGCKTALVLSGVTTREQSQAWEPKVDIIASSLGSLFV